MKVDSYPDVGKLVNDFFAEVFFQPVPQTESWRDALSIAIG